MCVHAGVKLRCLHQLILILLLMLLQYKYLKWLIKVLCLILCWNEYFLAALITSTDAKTMPVMVASQISSQSIKWWNMAAISAALCLPLIIVAIFLERYIVKGMAAGAIKGYDYNARLQQSIATGTVDFDILQALI